MMSRGYHRQSTVAEAGIENRLYLRLFMRADETICLNSKVNGKQPSLEFRIYHPGGGSTCYYDLFLLQYFGDSL
jgi:hypothetical protein